MRRDAAQGRRAGPDPGLARARTSLAWLRTAIAFAAIGGVILRRDVAAGLSWLVRSARSARAAGGPRRILPGRLALLHGLLASATFVLAVLTALAASRG